MNNLQRGDKVIEVATGRKATIVFVNPFGTDSHRVPWAKVMFNNDTAGVGFACRDLSELREEETITEQYERECAEHDAWLVVLAGITPDSSQLAPTVVYHDTADGAPHIAGTHPDMCTECYAMHGDNESATDTTIRLSKCSKCGAGINPFVDGFVVVNGATHCDNCVSELPIYCGGSEPGSEWECGTLDGKPCTCPILCELCGSEGAVINSNGDSFCDGHCIGCPQLQNAACPCDCGHSSIVGKGGN